MVGALLLLADLTVTAALSGWSALTYITSGAEQVMWIKVLRDHIGLTTIGMLLFLAWINHFGPKHSGTLAVALAVPTALVVLVLIGISAPHLTTQFLEPRHEKFSTVWVQFVGVILALSGVEAIANLTGVMKLDPGSTMDTPKVGRESLKAILPVAIEVVFGTALLGWAMLSLPKVLGQTLHLTNHAQISAALHARNEDMLRFIGEQFGAATVSPWFGIVFGWVVGIVFFLPALERGQHGDRRDDRSALHDGARRRNAASVHEPEQTRRPVVSVTHRGRFADAGVADGDQVHRARGPLRDRGSGRDRGESRLVHVQSQRRLSPVMSAVLFAVTLS